MTMLYRLDAPSGTVARTFGAAAGDDPWAGGYAAPGRFAPVITAGREAVAGPRPPRTPRRMVPRLWGVPPPPSAHDPTRLVSHVAKADSPFWIGNLRNSEFRCLVPATCFIEWGAGTDVEGRRERYAITCTDQPIMALAGVWKDSEVPSFALLTCPANPRLKGLGRARMPVILRGDEAQQCWLRSEWRAAEALLKPAPDDSLHARLLDDFA
ncbi:SOS response-associated peptidase family protein [Alteraurantiacibacter palmitatis]|uniref:Abasic site processing protein n=1 Tax=Alteraurantiacibacter palmitatis TaxID=2054628 RepID=A0ABV7E261_9SPHN